MNEGTPITEVDVRKEKIRAGLLTVALGIIAPISASSIVREQLGGPESTRNERWFNAFLDSVTGVLVPIAVSSGASMEQALAFRYIFAPAVVNSIHEVGAVLDRHS